MECKSLFVFVVCAAFCNIQGSPFPRDSTVAKTDEVKRFHTSAEQKDKVIQVTSTEKIDLDKTDAQGTTELVPPKRIDVPTEQNELFKETKDDFTTSERSAIVKPLHVACKHEEPTDDLICQEHCLPKGYSYGLCVGFKCSCI